MEPGAGARTRSGRQDGKFYLLPGLHEKPWQDYSLAVRTDILEQLNLQVPKTWDELYTMLKAMKAAYPASYPFSDRFSKPTPGGNLLNILTASYGTRGGWDYQHATWDAERQEVRATPARRTQYKQMLRVPQQAGDGGAARPGELHPDRRRRAAEARQRQVVRDQQPTRRRSSTTTGRTWRRPSRTRRSPRSRCRSGPAGEINPAAAPGERHHDLHEGPGEQELRGHDAVHRLAVVLRRRPGVRQVGRRGHHVHQGRLRQAARSPPDVNVDRAQPDGHQAPAEGLRLLQRRVRLRRQHRAGAVASSPPRRRSSRR